jgi:DNA-directed RNA polymerase subunit K/omega
MLRLELTGDELVKHYNEQLDRYFIVNIISKRARALVDGEKPLVDPAGTIRLSEVAVRELVSGKLKVVPKATRNKLVDIVREVTERS